MRGRFVFLGLLTILHVLLLLILLIVLLLVGFVLVAHEKHL